MTKKKVFIVAGEPSGDFLGSQIIKDIKKDIDFYGVGGDLMVQEGLHPVLHINQLSVMGFWDVLTKILTLYKHLRHVKKAILDLKPDVVVTIDYPGFNFYLAKWIKKNTCIPVIHYVCPTSIWSRNRNPKDLHMFDHLLYMFPFEKRYLPDIPKTFVGHPIAARDMPNHTKRDQYTICMLLGSRKQEIKKHLPIFTKALSMFEKDICVYVPTFSQFEKKIRAYLNKHSTFPFEVIEQKDKYKALAASDVALCASGTIVLELAKMNIPCVVGYKTSAFNAFIARRVIKIPYVSLVNIIAGKLIVPELLLENCTPLKLYEALVDVDKNRDKMIAAYTRVIDLLKSSHSAAQIVEKCLA